MVFTSEGFFEEAVESGLERDLSPRPLNTVYIYMKIKKKSFSNETLDFFPRKFWASYILYLAKTV